VGRYTVQLNAKQVEILAWVRDGAPASRYADGYAHRIVARTPNNRGFVRIDGHGAGWSIRITEAGLAWFEKPLAPAEPQVSDLDQLVDDVLEEMRLRSRTGNCEISVGAQSATPQPIGLRLVTCPTWPTTQPVSYTEPVRSK
jgi:hypothetical protein